MYMVYKSDNSMEWNMPTLKASQSRIPPDLFNRVAYQGERVRIERRGARPVYLISQDDLDKLEQLEDQLLAAEGGKALRAFKDSGTKAIPWKKTKAKLGL